MVQNTGCPGAGQRAALGRELRVGEADLRHLITSHGDLATLVARFCPERPVQLFPHLLLPFPVGLYPSTVGSLRK